MSKKVLGNIEPKCVYCAHGKTAPNGKDILCIRSGVTDKDGSCKKFKYDPLKREPRKPAPLAEYGKDDFIL